MDSEIDQSFIVLLDSKDAGAIKVILFLNSCAVNLETTLYYN